MRGVSISSSSCDGSEEDEAQGSFFRRIRAKIARRISNHPFVQRAAISYYNARRRAAGPSAVSASASASTSVPDPASTTSSVPDPASTTSVPDPSTASTVPDLQEEAPGSHSPPEAFVVDAAAIVDQVNVDVVAETLGLEHTDARALLDAHEGNPLRAISEARGAADQESTVAADVRGDNSE
jgi:hypothetical protein